MNYKLDIKKMTVQFNAVNKANGKRLLFTFEQMSEMVQRHAFKLGYSWRSNDIKNQTLLNIDSRYLFICDNLIITYGWTEDETFKQHSNKEIGLDFFSIEPELKTVTVKMSMKDYKSYSSAPIGKDWELVE